MAVEIERKFLVRSESFKQEATHSILIKQFYLPPSTEGETLRIRFVNNTAFLTRKGLSTPDGLARTEEEHPISLKEAEQMLQSPLIGSIEKMRYYVPFEGFTWEVDCFLGKLKGLIIAEVELKSTTDTPPLPEWIGKEVTGDIRYYNAQLSIAQSVPE
ncbi:CYTH domain-containing protein [Porphyromonas circumdentaria]|uniref:CYTH domain-containing protein n=1 Tax=Porphyromonas circumdentaria TaxID=29524 RepID=A0A1T4MWL0_9PORP|nr:CYTH domain-containing protein [Porphyromonas circumdentaria]MBB6275957.1 CYTH domain-containing protein [Porphyromonas circumdentaria]MDO4721980.1 CYTH domain-containing protein [Porphyromonas circumdentaria]SJZ71234.1 CYTH domain-containing protein [Porphyromonas circumdentaria]